MIGPALSQFESAFLFLQKKDGTFRFCMDYRKLDFITVRDLYPLPLMDETIDSLGNAKLFFTLDTYWGYWKVPIREKDCGKTAFVCHAGLYLYRRMPFGLTNALTTFQQTLDIVLSSFK